MTVLLVAGCTSTPATTAAATTTSNTTTATPITAAGPVPTTTANDLKSGSAHHNLVVDGETFRLKVDYFTTSDTSTWSALGPKDIHLLAYLNPAADTTLPAVMIDDFQAQYRLLAANPNLNALVIADTQDQPAGGVDGFLITPTVSYGTVFTSDGTTPELLQRWQTLGGRQPLNDETLSTAGVYAVALTFTYRLLVRGKGDTGWHRRTTTDLLTVPLASTAVATTTSASAPASAPAKPSS